MKGSYIIHVDDWEAQTAGLSLLNECAYLRIIFAMHKAGGAIPNCNRLLCSLWETDASTAQEILAALFDAGLFASITADTLYAAAYSDHDTVVRSDEWSKFARAALQ